MREDTMKIATKFESVTVLLPVINETLSLKKTIEIIEESSSVAVKEYVMIVCQKTTKESLEICRSYVVCDPRRYIIHHQKLPFLGGAIREAFDLSQGSHVIMMASDLETNPEDVVHFINHAKSNPHSIITASRWLKGGTFEGYNSLKWFFNFVFQKFFSLIYKTKLSDMTYGYRLFPTSVVQNIHWEELRHPFLFETLIKPLRLNIPVIEIPSVWKARVEGESQNTFFRNFLYFKIGLKVRFSPKARFLKQSL